MTAELLTRPDRVGAFDERTHGDVEEREHLLEVADTLAAMEVQFKQATPGLKERLHAQKDALIEELTAEKPGETLLNEVILLASVLHRRITEARLQQDGSTVRAFGTRDKHNIYLEETYILHEKPHGGYHYMVRRQMDRTALLYELDDQAGLKITREANKFVPKFHKPTVLEPESAGYQDAVKDLLSTTLTAMGEMRTRSDQERASADIKALSMIEDSPFATQFLRAESSAEVMTQVEALMTVEPHILSKDALRRIVDSAQH